MREQVTSDQLQGAPDRQIVSLRHGRLAVRANIQQELRGPQATESLLRFAKLVARGADLSDRRCFRRAPGPAPFSSINSTPAFSRALRMADAFANVIAVFSSTESVRWIVARLSYRFFLGALADWPRTAFAAADGLDDRAAIWIVLPAEVCAVSHPGRRRSRQ